jgi:hypothetical protein
MRAPEDCKLKKCGSFCSFAFFQPLCSFRVYFLYSEKPLMSCSKTLQCSVLMITFIMELKSLPLIDQQWFC